MKKIYLLFPLFVFFLIAALSGCGETESGENGHVHSFGPWEETLAATCTQEGREERRCECGQVEGRPISALGHDPVTHPGQAPTCTQKGWDEYTTCNRCGATTYRELPKAPHELVEHSAKEATCMQGGWAAYYSCKNCPYSTKKITSPLGHDWQKEYAVDTEPTYTTVGSESIHCNRCGLTKNAREIPKVTSGYVLSLKNDKGILLRADCKAEIFDETGKKVADEQFVKGVCTADLAPASYRMTLKDLPKGYHAEADGYAFGETSEPSLSVSTSVIRGESAPSRTHYKVGDVLYDFTVTLEKKSYTLSELTRQYDLILINFWASWCGPCMMEMPMLQETYVKYQKSVFVMALSIEANDTAETIASIKSSKGLTFPVGSDRENKLWQYFDTGSIPTCVYIDSNGLFVSGKGFAFEELFSLYAKPDSAFQTSSAPEQVLQSGLYLPPRREEM